MNTDNDILAITKLLEEAGIKATAQRIAVCQYVLGPADHPTAEEVKSAVDQVFPKISLATVYNTLNTLVEAGLLKAVKSPDSDKVLFDFNTKDHYHFVDGESGRLIDLDPMLVDIQHSLPEEFKVDSVEVFIMGKAEG